MTPAELHSAGATVVHDAFKHLEVPTTTERPTREFVVRWVQPFYMKSPESAEWAAAF